MNLKEVWRVYYRLMRKEIRTFSKEVPKQPVRLLYENAPHRPEFLKSRLIDNSNVVMVTVKLLVDGKRRYFHGFGNTKLQAKRAAAKCALKSLGDNW
ncbi:Endoribonuclease Dcr-1 [Blattella germanica]|nr:Endoribonuclease Dcr-1 [Blattella germanica]